jgi:hypothetical protein
VSTAAKGASVLGKVGRAAGVLGTVAGVAALGYEAYERVQEGRQIGAAGIKKRAPWAVADVGIQALTGLPGVASTVGGWMGMTPGSEKGATPPGEKRDPIQTLIDETRKTNALLGELKGDLNAGVGSKDIIDVMGEARTLRLLAGKLAG